MGKLYDNYKIKIENSCDNKELVELNKDKDVRFVISVKIRKISHKYKNDMINYVVRIYDDLSIKLNADESINILSKSYDHFSLSHDEKVKHALNLVEEKLKERNNNTN